MYSKKDDLKDKLTKYLTLKGIDHSSNFRCLNPLHDDKNPSMSLIPGNNRYVKCFGCNAYFDIFDLVAIDAYNVPISELNGRPTPIYSFSEVRNKTVQFLNAEDISVFNDQKKLDITENRTKIELVNTKVIERSQETIEDGLPYLKKRGISLEVAKKLGLGFSTKWVSPTLIIEKEINPKPTKRLILPTGPSSYTARLVIDDFQLTESELKYEKVKEGHPQIFNSQAIRESKDIFIVEGELDAASIIQTGLANAIALGSISNVKLLEKTLEKELAHLSQGVNFYISMDNDEPGQNAKLKVKNMLSQLRNKMSSGTYKYRFSYYDVNICGDQKDPNAALCNDKDNFFKSIKRTLNDPDDYLNGFIKGISFKNEVLSTGFNSLDRILGGGLLEGLYGIGAISSIGKTTFVMQIADSLAKRQIPTMIFSMEMDKDTLTSKNLSRLTYQTTRVDEMSLSSREILYGKDDWNDEQRNTFNQAVKTYGKYYTNMTIFEGTEKPLNVNVIQREVQNYKVMTGKAPVVIVDYLQFLAPVNDKTTDKVNVTNNVRTLKSIAIKYHTPVIVISSINRDAYQAPVQFKSFKESGDIEYTADVLIGIQPPEINERFNFNQYNSRKERAVNVTVLKNRNGRSGESARFKFNSKYNVFIPN